jgi:hypothetical protein
MSACLYVKRPLCCIEVPPPEQLDSVISSLLSISCEERGGRIMLHSLRSLQERIASLCKKRDS